MAAVAGIENKATGAGSGIGRAAALAFGRSCVLFVQRLLAADHLHLRRGVAVAFGLDLGRRLIDLARSSSVSSTSAAPIFSSRRCSLVVPGIGTMYGRWASSQASATCAGRRALLVGDALRRSTNAWFFSIASGWKRGDVRAEVVRGSSVSLDGAGQEALAERAIGHEADPELVAGVEDAVRLGRAPPERIFVLKRGDRLDRMRAAKRLHARLGQAEMPDLALGDQVADRTATSSIGTSGSTRCW